MNRPAPVSELLRVITAELHEAIREPIRWLVTPINIDVDVHDVFSVSDVVSDVVSDAIADEL